MTLQPPLMENLVGTLGVERNRFRPDATEAVDGFGSPEPMMSGASISANNAQALLSYRHSSNVSMGRDPTYRSEDQLCVWLANDC
jgi:hypothetical protein